MRCAATADPTTGKLPSISRRAVTVVAVALWCSAVTACVPDMSAPARTAGAYEAHAATTATTAASAAATASLATRSIRDGTGFLPTMSVTIGDAERSLVGAATTFGAVLPPGPSSQRLRARLVGLLRSAQDDVAAARTAVRHGDERGLGGLAAVLDHDAAALQRFGEQHS